MGELVATARARPFIKWAGGKQSLCTSLIEFFPEDFKVYYEPFLGGGSILFELAPTRAVVSDSNRWLVDTYIAIRDDWLKVTRKLQKLENTKDTFMRIRRVSPETLSLVDRAAHFIYLNKTCFRGLYRVNKKGEFNVPYGEYNRRYFDPENIRQVSNELKKYEIRSCDFELGIAGVGEGDFVYFDPPYYKLGGYSDFDRYTPDKFKEKDHIRLAALCRELDHRGVRWAVSNSDTEFVRSLFSDFRIEVVDAKREINLNSKNRHIKELLILNY